jgi:hypothetical protein
MTVLSVIGFEGGGVGTQQGLDALAGLASAIKQVNPQG